MGLTVDDLERYGSSIEAIADEAEAEYLERIAIRARELRPDGGLSDAQRISILRDDAIEAMVELEEAFGAATGSVGAELYAASMSAAVTPLDLSEGADVGRTSKSARYWARFLDGTDEGLERFIDGTSARLRRVVSHYPDLAIARSAAMLGGRQRDVRFARVPNGPSCGFCIMLASRGFVYATRELAGYLTRFHDHCDCRVIAGFDGLVVEGYDPDALYGRYAACRRAVNGGRMSPVDGPLWHDWLALSPEERDRYGRGARARPAVSDPAMNREFLRRYGAQADGFDDYMAHRIAAEMDTRDREWLYSGRLPEIDYSLNPLANYGNPKKSGDYSAENFRDLHGEWRDVFAHDALRKNGFAVRTRPSQAHGVDGRIMGGVTNPDIFLGGQLWEIKSRHRQFLAESNRETS